MEYAAAKQYLNDMAERIAGLITAKIGTVHTQVQQTEARLSAKIDDINTRLDRHAGLLQTGTRQMTRFVKFSERSSRNWQTLAQPVDVLERLNDGAK